MATKGLRNGLIGPIGTIRIGFQKDVGVLDLVGGRLARSNQGCQWLPLLVLEADSVSFVQKTPPGKSLSHWKCNT